MDYDCLDRSVLRWFTALPTRNEPGTEGKIKVLRRRAELLLPLWNSHDAPYGYLSAAAEYGQQRGAGVRKRRTTR
jgi:hypothetical protein